MDKVLIGLYGDNGHQVTQLAGAVTDGSVEIAAACACNNTPLGPEVRRYDTLEEMLADPRIHLISLCSPYRSEQAGHAIQCLRAGKHVYAEKPAAFTEAELDAILAEARRSGCKFHEMANVTYKDIYETLRKLVAQGAVGQVTQILTQKSYTPSLDYRPQDENVDGGLLLQVGIYNMRYAEQISGKPITQVEAAQTNVGNPGTGNLHTAVSFLTQHQDGVVGVGVSNYCNPSNTYGTHGNETIRVFGTDGFAEITDYGKHWRLCTKERDWGAFPVTEKTRHYFYQVVDELLGRDEIPEPLEEELHPLRMAIRARTQLLERGGGSNG